MLITSGIALQVRLEQVVQSGPTIGATYEMEIGIHRGEFSQKLSFNQSTATGEASKLSVLGLAHNSPAEELACSSFLIVEPAVFHPPNTRIHNLSSTSNITHQIVAGTVKSIRVQLMDRFRNPTNTATGALSAVLFPSG